MQVYLLLLYYRIHKKLLTEYQFLIWTSPENSQIGGSLSSIGLGNFGFSNSVIKMIHVPIR
jgi:hypothetical protein